MDLETGMPNINRWVRGICGYGVMPANGLTYVPLQQCACFPNAQMPGLIAYGGKRQQESQRLVSDERPSAEFALQSIRGEKGSVLLRLDRKDGTPQTPVTAGLGRNRS